MAYNKTAVINMKHFIHLSKFQWVERLTRGRWIPVSREFEPQQRPGLFP